MNNKVVQFILNVFLALVAVVAFIGIWNAFGGNVRTGLKPIDNSATKIEKLVKKVL
jgi:hypothetical protein